MPRWSLIDQFITHARMSDIEGLESMFKTHSLLVNALDRDGWNALARTGDRESTHWLLERGAVSPPEARRQADVTFVNYVGSGNLRRAKEHLDFFELNLAQLENHHQSTNVTILHRAIASPEMTEFVLDLGADRFLESRTGPGEEGRKAGLTPLQMAARNGYRETATLLLERGSIFDVFTAAVLDDVEKLSAVSIEELDIKDHYGASPLALGSDVCSTPIRFLFCWIGDSQSMRRTTLAKHLSHWQDWHRVTTFQLVATAVTSIALLRRRGAKVDVFNCCGCR